MKRPKVTRTAAIVLLAATSIGLAACSAQPAETDGKTTVSWWTWNPDETTADPWIEAFEAEHPDITIEHRFIQFSDYTNAVRLAAAGDSGPDVFGLQVGAMTTQFAPLAVDLAPLAEEGIGTDWQDQLLATDQLEVDGKQVGLPWMITAGGLVWYNKNIFDEAGATPPTTLAEWKDACAKVEGLGKTCFFQGAKDDWVNIDVFQSIANQIAPGEFYDAIVGESDFDSSDFVAAFDAWKTLFDDGIMQNGALGFSEYPDANDAFNKSEAAMVALGTWKDSEMTNAALGTLAATYGDQITSQVFLPIAFPDVVGGAKETGRLFGGPDVGWAVSAKSKNQDAAFTFVQWLTASQTGQEQMATTLQTPALRSVTLDDSDLVAPDLQKLALEEQATQLGELIGARQIPNADVQTALGQALSCVASGQMTSDEAAKSVQAAISAAYK